MSNVLAGIGRGQLEVLNDRVEVRRSNFERYINVGFNIRFQEAPSEYHSNRWLACLLIDPIFNKGLSREEIRLELELKNIEARPLWKPMHQQPVSLNVKSYLNGVSDKLFENGLYLPSGSNLTEKDFERIFECLDRVFAKYQNR
jgi:dTDP-4-amino-4,6-dideoxygalactose transaminase